METKELICIGCPMGCPLTVEVTQNEVSKRRCLCQKRSDKPYTDRNVHDKGRRQPPQVYLRKDKRRYPKRQDFCMYARNKYNQGKGAGCGWRCAA